MALAVTGFLLAPAMKRAVSALVAGSFDSGIFGVFSFKAIC
nr:hypothetical protein [Citrobacter freundii]